VSKAVTRPPGKPPLREIVIRSINEKEQTICREADKLSGTVLPEASMAAMLRCKVRYFTEGAVIGSKAFVNEAFTASRERFSARRKDGARRMKGAGTAASGVM
jgi:hypothetical protein